VTAIVTAYSANRTSRNEFALLSKLLFISFLPLVSLGRVFAEFA